MVRSTPLTLTIKQMANLPSSKPQEFITEDLGVKSAEEIQEWLESSKGISPDVGQACLSRLIALGLVDKIHLLARALNPSECTLELKEALLAADPGPKTITGLLMSRPKPVMAIRLFSAEEISQFLTRQDVPIQDREHVFRFIAYKGNLRDMGAGFALFPENPGIGGRTFAYSGYKFDSKAIEIKGRLISRVGEETETKEDIVVPQEIQVRLLAELLPQYLRGHFEKGMKESQYKMDREWDLELDVIEGRLAILTAIFEKYKRIREVLDQE
jgi:hypothetical protein